MNKKVEFKDLHKYYTKSVLVNEIVNYKPGDLFRIFKLMNPMNSDINFDNQPISIQYDAIYDKTLKKPYRGYEFTQLRHIASAIDYFNPNRIFDCGCGAGANYYYLKRHVDSAKSNYTGIDFSRFQIIKAIDRYQTSKKVSFEIMDMLNLKFQDDYFDFSFTESTLPFIREFSKAISNLSRVSKKGFFASVYTTDQRYSDIPFDKKNKCYILDTGSTWKFMNKVTPNCFYVPSYSFVMNLLKSMPQISVTENNEDQFFEPLGVKTRNVFIYPKEWYVKNKNSFKGWNFRPLM